MHKSRLGAIVIDCETDDLDGDAAFWSGALGGTPDRSSDPQFSNYVALRDSPAGPHVLIQKVDHPSRVHIDIESDDIDAEADADEVAALVAQSQKRSAVFDIITNPTNVFVNVK